MSPPPPSLAGSRRPERPAALVVLCILGFSLAFYDLLLAVGIFTQLQASPEVTAPLHSPALTKATELLRQLGESPRVVQHLLVPHAWVRLVTCVGFGLGGYWLLKWDLRGRAILLGTSLLAAFNSVFGLYPAMFPHLERSDLLAQMMEVVVAEGRLLSILQAGVRVSSGVSLGFSLASAIAVVGFSVWAWVYLRRPEVPSLFKPPLATPL